LAQPLNCIARPLNTRTPSIGRAECGPTKHRKNTRDPFAIRVRVRAAYLSLVIVIISWRQNRPKS